MEQRIIADIMYSAVEIARLLHTDIQNIYKWVKTGEIPHIKLPAKSVDCVHNHPRSSSFSPDDLIVMCDFESIDKMLVIGHNGIKYKVAIGAGDRPYPAEIKAIYEQVKWEYKGFYERMTAAGVSEQAIWQAISHKITTRMAEKYGWEYERTQPKK